MSPLAVLGEALRAARAARGFTGATALSIALASLAVSLTAGQTATAEREVSAELRSAATRTIVVEATQSPIDVPATSITALGSRDDVGAVLSLGPAVDATHPAFPTAGTFTAVRTATLAGDPHLVLVLDDHSRAPGTITVPAPVASRLTHGVSGLRLPDGTTAPISGSYRTIGGTTGRLTAALAWPGHDTIRARVRILFVVATTADAVPTLARDLPGHLGVTDPTTITVHTAGAFDAVRDAVEGQLGSHSRNLVFTAAAVSAGWVALTTWMWILAKTRDLGRRRVLGAARSTVFALILTQVMVAIASGAVVGNLGYTIAAALTSLDPLPTEYTLASATILIASATVGTSIPAATAAHRDPVRAVRSP